MSLTMGGAPLAERPAGGRNYEQEVPGRALWFEPWPRRIRVRFGGETVADTRAAKLLHETACLPVVYLPAGDVRQDALERSEKRTRCPYKGEASYWHVRVGDTMSRDAVWAYEDPIASARFLGGHFAFVFDAADEWLEEEERMRVHPRDPYHRVEILRSSRLAEVRVAGRTIARSERPRLLFETSLPVRVYFPPADVDASSLEPASQRTGCPYKGEASYRSAVVHGRRVDAVAWCYEDPLPEAHAVAGHLAFPQEHEAVSLFLDGELQG